MDELLRALEAENYPRALTLALVAWRTTRAGGLADLIDHVAARCELPEPPSPQQGGRHKWWLAQTSIASTPMQPISPEPVVRSTLIAMLKDNDRTLDDELAVVRKRWSGRKYANPLERHLGAGQVYVTNFQERLACVLQWEDDPRVARALVELVRGPALPYHYSIRELLDLIADLIGRIGDQRVVAELERIRAEPRGTDTVTRTNQTGLATRALGALALRPEPSDPGPLLARCLALVAPPPPPPPLPPRIDVDALWREVAANPNDIGTRMVLGDALIECGDLRGDLFVLQCNARDPRRPLRGSKRDRYDGRVRTLIRTQWHAWFGDVGLALIRRGSEFHCGMLEVARVGTSASPPWAFAKARGHRELVCVHTVRPNWVSPEDFATFVLALPRFPRTLAVDSPAVIDVLAARGAPLDQLLTVELVRHPADYLPAVPRPGWPSVPLATSLKFLAAHAPGLRELRVLDPRIARDLQTMIDRMRALFPQLLRVAIDQPTLQAERMLRASALVEILPDEP